MPLNKLQAEYLSKKCDSPVRRIPMLMLTQPEHS